MKKLFTITESDRERILDLHSKYKNKLNEEGETSALGTAVNAFQAQRLQNKSQRQQDRADATQARANEFASQLPQQPTPQQPAPQQPAPQQPAPQQPAPQQPAPQQPAAPQDALAKYKTAACPGKDNTPQNKSRCVPKDLGLQMLVNDKCPTTVLTAKLKEDGIIGTNTRKALELCSSYIKVSPQGGQPGVPAGAQSTPPPNNQPAGASGAPGTPAGAVGAASSGSSEQFDSLDV